MSKLVNLSFLWFISYTKFSWWVPPALGSYAAPPFLFDAKPSAALETQQEDSGGWRRLSKWTKAEVGGALSPDGREELSSTCSSFIYIISRWINFREFKRRIGPERRRISNLFYKKLEENICVISSDDQVTPWAVHTSHWALPNS